MPNSQPSPERDDARQVLYQLPQLLRPELWISIMEGTKIADTTTINEENSSELTQSTDKRTDDEQEASETIVFAISLVEQCKADFSLSNLNNAIFIFREVLEQSAVTQSLHLDALASLASALALRFVLTEDQANLFEVLELGRRILEIKSTVAIFSGNDDESDIKEMLDMAQVILRDLSASTSLATLDTIILLLEQSLTAIPPGHPKHQLALAQLAYGRYMRFHHLDDTSDVNQIISILQGDTLDDKQGEIDSLRHLLAGASAHSTSANSDGRHAIVNQPSDNTVVEVGENMALLHHANNLIKRFQTSGNVHDLDSGIELMSLGLKEAVGGPNYAIGLSSLAVALQMRFQQQGDDQDLDDALSIHRQVLELRPPSHPDRSFSLDGLGSALKTLFQHRGDVQDLNEAISFHRQALELRAPSHSNRFTSLNNLANSLSIRFEEQGDAQDLNEAISFRRQAHELLPPSHPKYAASLMNLGVALWNRHEERGDCQDLNEAISYLSLAIKLLPPSHPNHAPSLMNLAIALWSRFEQQDDAQDLDEAIVFYRKTLKLLPPSNENHSTTLNNLAIALRTRFEQRGDAQDLKETILLHRKALELMPLSHRDYSMSLNNLGVALQSRFEQQGDAQDLNEAISFHKRALELRSQAHPDRSDSLSDLALALLLQFENGGDTSQLEQSMLLFSQATHAPSQPSSGRFEKAKTWAYHGDQYQHSSAMKAFDTSLRILPELAALGLDIQSRQDSLTRGTDGLARRAAGCAIRVGNLDKAVEFLETGRSVFWMQFLSLRSPLDQLHDVAPHLEKELRWISNELDGGSHREKSIVSLTNSQKLSWEEEAQRFEKLDRQWKKTVNKVRDLEGFEDFLQPKRLLKLQTAAKRGPIVYLIANDDTSNCLIMTSTQPVHHIPLPNLPLHVLSELVKLVQIAASPNQRPRSIEGIMEKWADLPQPTMKFLQRWMVEEERGTWQRRRTPGHRTSDDVFKYVLRILWNEAVKPVIDFLGLKKSGDHRPTLTWCTTGLFTFLPVHAAGRYEEKLTEYASEYIISSHTPTIGALLISNPPPDETFRMMAVIQSQTLPSTRKELEKIGQYVAANSLIKFGIEDARASVEAVASHLSSTAIVHFACHGIQDSENPLHSGLEIEGERLTISRIMKESVPNGALAFLCACETAMGDEKIPDEAMSIGASLLFTGFQSVIATMWRMSDNDGPVIADAFYKELFKGPDGNLLPLPDTSKSAYALAIAVDELRSRGVEFRRWVPFIHIGK